MDQARLLSTLHEVFSVRLYEAIGDGGPLTLFIGGDQLFARTTDGQLYNLDRPEQALMMVGEELPMRPLAARERRRRTSTLTTTTKNTKTGLTTKVTKNTKKTDHKEI